MSLLDKRFRGTVEEIRFLPAAKFIVTRPGSLSFGHIGAILYGDHSKFCPRPPQPFRVRPGASVVHYLATTKRDLGIRIGTRCARSSNDPDSTPALSCLGVAARAKASSCVTLARDAFLFTRRLIVILLAITFACCLVAGRIVTFRLVAMTRSANRRTPPGCWTWLIGLDFAVISRIFGRIAFASVSSTGRRVLDTSATVVAGIQIANTFTVTSYPPGRANALACLPLRHTDRCLWTVYVALSL